jgi:hypothetical protein
MLIYVFPWLFVKGHIKAELTKDKRNSELWNLAWIKLQWIQAYDQMPLYYLFNELYLLGDV